MTRFKQIIDDRVIPVLLFLAIFGCFAAIAMTPDQVSYPDLNLLSEDLVRLEAQYSNRVEIINRGRLIERSKSQLLIRNQDGDLVSIPFSAKTKLEGFGVSQVNEIDLGSVIAVKQLAGSDKAVSIRSLQN